MSEIGAGYYADAVLAAPGIEVRPHGTVTDAEVEAAGHVIYEKDAAIYGWSETFGNAHTSTRTRYYHVARAALEAAWNERP